MSEESRRQVPRFVIPENAIEPSFDPSAYSPPVHRPAQQHLVTEVPPEPFSPDLGKMLDELQSMLADQIQVPRLGADAAAAMIRAFEATAAAVERLGQDAVDRAELVHAETQSYAAVMRQAGIHLAAKIEMEARRGLRVSKVIARLRESLDDIDDPEKVPGSEG